MVGEPRLLKAPITGYSAVGNQGAPQVTRLRLEDFAFGASSTFERPRQQSGANSTSPRPLTKPASRHARIPHQTFYKHKQHLIFNQQMSFYPGQGGYGAQQHGGYGPPRPSYSPQPYPPQGGGGYGYGTPPQQQGYGYGAPPPQVAPYGYNNPPPPQQGGYGGYGAPPPQPNGYPGKSPSGAHQHKDQN